MRTTILPEQQLFRPCQVASRWKRPTYGVGTVSPSPSMVEWTHHLRHRRVLGVYSSCSILFLHQIQALAVTYSWSVIWRESCVLKIEAKKYAYKSTVSPLTIKEAWHIRNITSWHVSGDIPLQAHVSLSPLYLGECRYLWFNNCISREHFASISTVLLTWST